RRRHPSGAGRRPSCRRLEGMPRARFSSFSARVPFLSIVVVSSFSASKASAQTQAPQAITLGDDVVFATTTRSRTYGWNGFGDSPAGEYVYQGSQIRFGLLQAKRKYDWQLEFEVPFMIGLPTDAVQAAPQGQLGLGANYYAANGNRQNPAHLFLKQGTFRFK